MNKKHPLCGCFRRSVISLVLVFSGRFGLLAALYAGALIVFLFAKVCQYA
jgi:hypothetical protein